MTSKAAPNIPAKRALRRWCALVIVPLPTQALDVTGPPGVLFQISGKSGNWFVRGSSDAFCTGGSRKRCAIAVRSPKACRKTSRSRPKNKQDRRGPVCQHCNDATANGGRRSVVMVVVMMMVMVAEVMMVVMVVMVMMVSQHAADLPAHAMVMMMVVMVHLRELDVVSR